MPTNLLRWPGGKQWATDRLLPLVRAHLSGTYFEPFLGGGALFFALKPVDAVLSDVNAELINTYRMVREHPRAVVNRIKAFPVSAEHYYKIRSQHNGGPLDRAARFLYLNRTCFGGIYRLNEAGRFNVPFGGGDRTPALLWERGILPSAAWTLKRAELQVSDFEPIVDRAMRGDVVYCDPTYTVAHDRNGFIRYNEKNFQWRDQERLAEAVLRAHGRGATVVVTNAHHEAVLDLFRPPQVEVLGRQSCVSSHVRCRRAVNEYLFIWPGAFAPATQTIGPAAGKA